MEANVEGRRDLDRATVELGKELFVVKGSLDIYTLIGLNAARIQRGKMFFGHTQYVSLLHVALGLAKVFEREGEQHRLSSLSGVYRLAKEVPMENAAASQMFAAKYGVAASVEWVRDVDAVFAKQRPIIRRQLRRVYRARNTRIAHLQQAAPVSDLPSIAAFEGLLTLAVEFHRFINAAFLGTGSHPILNDRGVWHSLVAMLRETGVETVLTDFPNG